MLVLIDESGDSGFKFTKNSSPFFTIGMVVFSNFTEAEKANKNIGELQKKMQIAQEFKFSKTHPNIKDAFFHDICKHDFLVHALIVDKRNISNNRLKNNKDDFYKICMKKLMEEDDTLLKNAKIKIDGNGTKSFRISLRKYLQDHVGNQKIASLKFADSKRDNLEPVPNAANF